MNCRMCGNPLMVGSIWWPSCATRRDYRCTTCCLAGYRLYRLNHLVQRKEYEARYYKLNKDAVRARTKSYYNNNRRIALLGQRF